MDADEGEKTKRKRVKERRDQLHPRHTLLLWGDLFILFHVHKKGKVEFAQMSPPCQPITSDDT